MKASFCECHCGFPKSSTEYKSQMKEGKKKDSLSEFWFPGHVTSEENETEPQWSKTTISYIYEFYRCTL